MAVAKDGGQGIGDRKCDKGMAHLSAGSHERDAWPFRRDTGGVGNPHDVFRIRIRCRAQRDRRCHRGAKPWRENRSWTGGREDEAHVRLFGEPFARVGHGSSSRTIGVEVIGDHHGQAGADRRGRQDSDRLVRARVDRGDPDVWHVEAGAKGSR